MIETAPIPWAILGGGPAGLSVGYFAAQRGVPFTIYEASEQVGGNARTIRFGEFLFDTGAHRFHDKHPQITLEVQRLLGDDLLSATAPSQIVFGRKRVDFPLTPVNLLLKMGPRLLFGGGRDFVAARFSPKEGNGSFESFAIRQYGETIARQFLLNYSSKLWGVPAHRLSPLISGKRLKGLDVRTFLVEILKGGRAKTEHLDGRFYYPRLGIGMLMDRLGDACGRSRIRAQARVTRIFHQDRRILGFEINGRERISSDFVISTLPLPLQIRLMDPAVPADIVAAAERLRFRHVLLVVLVLNCPRLSNNASLYFPEPDVPFTRAYEPKNRSAAMAPADRTSLVVEIPCGGDDLVWRQDHDALVKSVQEALQARGVLRAGQVTDSTVHRIPFAYPVLEAGFESVVAMLMDYLRHFENLRMVGRSGMFAYTHVHDLMQEGLRIVSEYAEDRVPAVV